LIVVSPRCGGPASHITPDDFLGLILSSSPPFQPGFELFIAVCAIVDIQLLLNKGLEVLSIIARYGTLVWMRG
jgi:hypothetical protein